MPNMLNQLSLAALRSFEAAARHLSFNKAAEELGVTSAAVSLQVRRLEDRIGRALFVRGSRGLELSDTGARLAPGLTRLFGDLDQLLNHVVAPETAILRISAMPSFASRWLAPRLAGFSAAQPRLNVRLEGDDALASFDRDAIDIGLRYGPGHYDGLFCEHIGEARAFPVCSPRFAERHHEAVTSPQALAGAPLLHDEIALKAPGLPSWSMWFEAAGVDAPVQPGLSFESQHMALAAAVAGQGVALGLTPLVDDDLSAGRLVRLFDIEVPSPFGFWLVCRADRARERKIMAFRRWIAGQRGLQHHGG